MTLLNSGIARAVLLMHPGKISPQRFPVSLAIQSDQEIPHLRELVVRSARSKNPGCLWCVIAYPRVL